jgi:predicted secreted protein
MVSADRRRGPERRPAQPPGGELQQRLSNFQRTYRACTPAANLAVRRYLDEGAKISREITARYTN